MTDTNKNQIDGTAKPSSAAIVRHENFRRELETLLNIHSRENESCTPDFILADYLIGCLRSFDNAVQRRTLWYDKTRKEIITQADTMLNEHKKDA